MTSLNVTDARIWRHGEVNDDISSESVASALLDKECLVWVDLLDPSEEQLRQLAEQLDIGPTAVEDALAPHERAKVTRHGEHLFFTVYATSLSDEPGTDGRRVLQVSRISGFVLPKGLVTIRLTDPAAGAFAMDDVLERWREVGPLLQAGGGALVHGLLDSVVDGHFETIQAFDDALEELEGELFAESRTGNDFLKTTFAVRKDLVRLRRAVLPMREVVAAVMRQRGHMEGELQAWFEDLYDHVLRASEWTESLRDLVTSVFETNLSLQDSRMNTIMKQLAAWGAIIAVPTAITGWYGQNIPYPGDGQMWGFWMSLIMIVVLSIGLYVVFRKRDWL